jgi:endogenous inhibitor of DNA gyrase (YacG/DUF329 family)
VKSIAMTCSSARGAGAAARGLSKANRTSAWRPTDTPRAAAISFGERCGTRYRIEAAEPEEVEGDARPRDSTGEETLWGLNMAGKELRIAAPFCSGRAKQRWIVLNAVPHFFT